MATQGQRDYSTVAVKEPKVRSSKLSSSSTSSSAMTMSWKRMGMHLTGLLALVGVLILATYFLTIRPQQQWTIVFML
jgi:hypothetical protein